MTADKVLFGNKLAVSGGFASIDRFYALNADRFFAGTRVFAAAVAPLSREWTAQFYATRAVHNDFRVPLGMRIDVMLQYNFVPARRRLNLVP